MFGKVLDAVGRHKGLSFRDWITGHHRTHGYPDDDDYVPSVPFTPASGVFSLEAANDALPPPDAVMPSLPPGDPLREAALGAVMASVHQQLPPDCAVVPWPIIPASAWAGANGNFLTVACEFYPGSLGNLMLLPRDQRSAAVLHLPRAPSYVSRQLEEDASNRISALRADMAEDHVKTVKLLEQGDLAALDACAERNARYRRDVLAVARTLGAAMFGPAVWDHHARMFGDVLGWPRTDAENNH